MDNLLKDLKAPKHKRDIAQNIAALQQKAKKYDRYQKLKLTAIYASVAALFFLLFATQSISPFTQTSASMGQIKSVEHKTYEVFTRSGEPSPWFAIGVNYLNEEKITILERSLRDLVSGDRWEFGGIEGQHYIDRLHAFDVYYIKYKNSDIIDQIGFTYLSDVESYVLVDFNTQLYTKISNRDSMILEGHIQPFNQFDFEEILKFVKSVLIGLLIYSYYKLTAKLSPYARRKFNDHPTLISWILKFLQWGLIIYFIKVFSIAFLGYVNGLLLLIIFAAFFFARKFWGDTPRSWWEVLLSTAVYLLAMILSV